MKILIFQHIGCEGPGSFRRMMHEAEVSWEAIYLHEDGVIPPLENYDALWVLGGPMDVWETEKYPWLIPEKEAIRTWVQELQKPFLGFCLGHQLLADALGGTCEKLSPPEIGVLDVEFNAAGKSDPIFLGLGGKLKCLQWHGVQVTQAPAGATILASSDACKNQAMRIGDKAWSMQFHLEIEETTFGEWAAVPTYREALMHSVGQAGYDKMEADCATYLPEFTRGAETLFANFINQVRK